METTTINKLIFTVNKTVDIYLALWRKFEHFLEDVAENNYSYTEGSQFKSLYLELIIK